jgi:hypothetical protein
MNPEMECKHQEAPIFSTNTCDRYKVKCQFPTLQVKKWVKAMQFWQNGTKQPLANFQRNVETAMQF